MCMAQRSFNHEIVICAPRSPMSCWSVHILHRAARVTCHGSRREIVAHETVRIVSCRELLLISLVALLPTHSRQERLRNSNRRSSDRPRLHSRRPDRPHLAFFCLTIRATGGCLTIRATGGAACRGE